MEKTAERTGRVLMTADAVGGVWTYAIELARALSAHNVEVCLATMGSPLSRAQIDESKAVSNLDVYESDFKLEWMENPWQNVALAGDWLLRLEEYLKPDIIHLNGYSHGSLDWGAPKLVVGHSCVLSWWETVKGGTVPGEWDRYAQEVKRGLESSDAVVAPSRSMLDSLRRHYGFTTPGRVIHNGRGQGRFRPGRKEEFVFTAGRLWDEAKNTAALEFVSGRLDWPVYAAGLDDHKSGRLAAGGSIKLVGQLSAEEMSAWLSRASIYALPAFYEPFGLSVLEAGLCGCALVLGDIPSLREIWEGAAVFVDPGDNENLRQAICSLIENNGRRSEYGKLARERALQFSPEKMASSYLLLYGELLLRGKAQKSPMEVECAL